MIKTLGVLGTGYILYYQFDTKVKLHFEPSQQMEEILSKCPSLSGNFRPSPWLFNGILQAVYGGTQGNKPNTEENPDYVKYDTETIDTPDNGLISIDWKSSADVKDDTKILLIAPGLTGSSESQYIRCAVNQAVSRGYRVAVFIGRGIGPNKLKVLPI